MKTTFNNLIYFAVLAASVCMASIGRADSVNIDSLGSPIGGLLAGDSFSLGEWTVPDRQMVSSTDWVPCVQQQTRSANSQLVGSVPEVREFDYDARRTQRETLESIEWQGSSTFNITPTGRVARAGSADDAQGTVAFVEGFRNPRTDDNWRVQADVKPLGSGGNNSVSIGFLSSSMESYQPGDSFLESSRYDAAGNAIPAEGLGEMWAMLSTIQRGGETFGRLCVFINGDDMILRFENPIDSANLSMENLAQGIPAAQKANFDYFSNAFNSLYLEWHTEDNSVSVNVNGDAVINHHSLNGFNFGPNNNNRPDIFGAGFQMLGGGELNNFQATPEPSSMIMMCFSMLFFGYHNRRNRRRARKLASVSLALMS